MEKSDYNNLGEIANNLLNESKNDLKDRNKKPAGEGWYWCTIDKKWKQDTGGSPRGGINEDHHDEDLDFQIKGLRKEILSQVENINDTDLLMKISHYIALRRDEAMTDEERTAREDMDQLDRDKAHDRAGLPPFSSKEPGVDW